MKKFLSVLLSVIILMAFLSYPLLTSADTAQDTTESDRSMEASSVRQNTRIIEYFRKDIVSKNSNVDMEKLSLEYPDYYGGSYINKNHELVILLKDDSKSVRNILISIAENKNLIFKKAKYSYAELTKSIDYIMGTKEKYLKNEDDSFMIAKDIVSCTLNDVQNNIEVNIKNLNQTKITNFYKYFSKVSEVHFVDDKSEFVYDDYIDNSRSDDIITSKNKSSSLTSTINSGASVFIKYGLSCSMAFPTSRVISSGTQYGFVTCAHGSAVGREVWKSDYSKKLGVIKLRKLGGKYDVSFVACSSGVTCSNVIKNTLNYLEPSNYEIDYPIVGETVQKYGRNGNTLGKVKSTNFSINVKQSDGTTTKYSGITKASYPASGGDSGGLIARPLSLEVLRMAQEGVHIGHTSQNGEWKYSYYCSAADIVNLWYLSCY